MERIPPAEYWWEQFTESENLEQLSNVDTPLDFDDYRGWRRTGLKEREVKNMIGNGRAAEQLNRKDMVFAAINSLALLDKKSIKSLLRINTVADVETAVADLAEKLNKYVESGSRELENGSQRSQCALCQATVPADEMCESLDGDICKPCYSYDLEEDAVAAEVGV